MTKAKLTDHQLSLIYTMKAEVWVFNKFIKCSWTFLNLDKSAWVAIVLPVYCKGPGFLLKPFQMTPTIMPVYLVF